MAKLLPIYAKRRDATCVDYDNLKVVNCLTGVVSCTSDERFIEYMKEKGFKVVWVKDLDAAWKERNG